MPVLNAQQQHEQFNSQLAFLENRKFGHEQILSKCTNAESRAYHKQKIAELEKDIEDTRGRIKCTSIA